MFNAIKLLVFGLLFVLLGVGSVWLKFVLGDEARLPFWPFDGIAAIVGGIFVSWWSFTVMKERND